VYTLITFSLLALPVFRPLTQAVVDPAITWQERARIAADLLTLHDHYWQWALGAGFVLALQCIHTFRVMNHLTGPLTRLRQALQHIKDGNLSIRTTLGRNDYLTTETELLNQTTTQLQARLSACKQAHAALVRDYDRLKQSIPATYTLDCVRLTKQVDQDLETLRCTLDWFKTHKG